MTRIIQNLFGLLVGFFGGWYALAWITGGRGMWVWMPPVIYCFILAGAFYVSSHHNSYRGLAVGFCVGAALMAGLSSYGYEVPTILLVTIGICTVGIWNKPIGQRARLVCVAWLLVSVAATATFTLDHLLLAGRLFAFKWSRIERPIFWSRYEIRPVEKIGSKAIYLFDYNGADPSAVAIVWGWTIFPKFAYPDEARPEGALLHNKAIQEVIR